mgnify:FL=1
MQRSRTNFAVLPPSIYPTPDAENTPAFETTYAEGYCERLNDVRHKRHICAKYIQLCAINIMI